MNRQTGRWLVAILLLSSMSFFAPDDLDAARKAFQTALASKDATALSEAVKKIASVNDARAVKVLLAAPINTNDQETYWVVLRGLASFTSPSAVKELGDFVLKKQNMFVRDLMSLLKYNHAPALMAVMAEILEKGTDELKLMAVDQLQEFTGKGPVGPLVAALGREGKKESELKSRIVKSLRAITGHDYGESASDWEGWWNQAKDQEWKAPDAPAENTAGGTGTVIDTFDRTRRSEYEKLKEPMGKIVVIESDECKAHPGINHDFDHIQEVLTRLGIPNTVIKKSQVETYEFKDVMAVLVNCNQFKPHCVCPDCHPTSVAAGNRMVKDECSKNPPVHINEAPIFTDRAVQRIALFVNQGGYLFTEDWEVEELLEKAFKGYVKKGDPMVEAEVTVLPNIGALAHPYMNRIFGEKIKASLPPPLPVGDDTSGTPPSGRTDLVPPPVVPEKEQITHQWKIDNESPVLVVENPAVVTVLMTSPELAKKYTNGGPVAITFLVGPGVPEGVTTGFQQDRKKMIGGRVLHVLSHFGKQKTREDEFALQNLLLNLLIEANERRLLKEKKK